MRRALANALMALALTIAVFIGISKHHVGQIRRKQWEENRAIIVVTVPLGAGIDQYGYHYKPEWMRIDEYREQIKELNELPNSTLYVGQELKLYAIKEANNNAQSSIHH